jgi:hypothetical protein
VSTRFEDVSKVLQTYFDALYHCDVAMLEEVFHPRAVYVTADEAPPLIRSMQEYFPIVAKRTSPASNGEVRRDLIEEMEFAGENTARARVRCSIGNKDFVDFLSLIREDTQWKIVAKVFQITERQIEGT